jgi:hypothetical protein
LWVEYNILIEEVLRHLRSKQHVQELDFLEILLAQVAMKEVMEEKPYAISTTTTAQAETACIFDFERTSYCR